MEAWINEIPNDGLIRYKGILNSDRLLLTGPKSLGEVLVQKNYEFVKPIFMVRALSRLLGLGILLAEGEEHKVWERYLIFSGF